MFHWKIKHTFQSLNWKEKVIGFINAALVHELLSCFCWLVRLQHSDSVWIGTALQLEYKHYLSVPGDSYRPAVTPSPRKSSGNFTLHLFNTLYIRAPILTTGYIISLYLRLTSSSGPNTTCAKNCWFKQPLTELPWVIISHLFWSTLLGNFDPQSTQQSKTTESINL